MGNADFHTIGILWERLIYSHAMGLDKKSIESKKTIRFQDIGNWFP